MLQYIYLSLFLGNFEREYDDATIKMIFGIVQIIGFSNSICNPIVYAFMNENFKKNFASAICFCVIKQNESSSRRRGHLGITMLQHREGVCKREPTYSEESRREAFSEGNIEVKFCDQAYAKKNSRKHLALFTSELTGSSSLGH